MLKFLTIIFFLHSLYTVATDHVYFRLLAIGVCNKIKQSIIDNNSTKIDDELTKQIVSIGLFIMTFLLILFIIEFIYIFYSIKYDPYKYIVILYGILQVIKVLKDCFLNNKQSTLNNELNIKIQDLSVDEAIKDLDNEIDKVSNISLKYKIFATIDLLFYAYMIYVFFIK